LAEKVRGLQVVRDASTATIAIKDSELHELEQKLRDLEAVKTTLADEIADLRAQFARSDAQNAESVMASASRVIHWASAFELRFKDFQAKEDEKLAQIQRGIAACSDKTTKCVKVSEVEELSDLLEKAQSEFVSTMKEEQDKHEFELAEVVSKLRAAESQKRLLNDVLDREREDSAQHLAIIEELGRQVDDEVAAKKALAGQLKANEMELAKSNQECLMLKATIAELEISAARDKTQIGNLREEAIADQAVMRQCESRIEELANQLSGSQQKCDEFCESVDDLRKEVLNLKQLLAEKTEKLDAAEAELARDEEVTQYQDEQLALADLTFGNVKLMIKRAQILMEAVLEERWQWEQEVTRLRDENRRLQLGLPVEPLSAESSGLEDNLDISGHGAMNDSTDA
jgi:chromosome segregation protein